MQDIKELREKGFISVGEYAKSIGISRTTVYRWLKSGYIPKEEYAKTATPTILIHNNATPNMKVNSKQNIFKTPNYANNKSKTKADNKATN